MLAVFGGAANHAPTQPLNNEHYFFQVGDKLLIAATCTQRRNTVVHLSTSVLLSLVHMQV